MKNPIHKFFYINRFGQKNRIHSDFHFLYLTLQFKSIIKEVMRIDILSVVPELLVSPLNHSIIKRAQDKGIVEIHIHNIRDWSNTAPDAPTFNQKMANELSLKENIMILCGHYKGIDQRIRDYLVTREISVGDYVLTGGELPACIMTDAIVRLIPGAMNDESSALSDSFQDDLLAPPVYTRPAEFNGWRVPDILLSGNHAKIREWQEKVAYERTKTLRPDLLGEQGDF